VVLQAANRCSTYYWHFSLPGSRIVEVLYDDFTKRCTSYCPPPPVARQVNQESRHVALDYYELCFGTSGFPPTLYFDLGMDLLYLGLGNITPNISEATQTFFMAIDKSDLDRLKHLIVDHELTVFSDFINNDDYDGSDAGDDDDDVV
jgi:hypothetical protein